MNRWAKINRRSAAAGILFTQTVALWRSRSYHLELSLIFDAEIPLVHVRSYEGSGIQDLVF